MTRQELFTWIRQQYGTEPEYPWHDWNAVLRHNDNNKWYGVVLEVSADKLGLPEVGIIDVLNVKSDPLLIGSLRRQDGYFPAYHMNKEKWLKRAEEQRLRQRRMEREAKERERLAELYEDCDDRFAFIAGYTDGGAPYGVMWEEVGIDPGLPFEEKVKLYHMQMLG